MRAPGAVEINGLEVVEGALGAIPQRVLAGLGPAGLNAAEASWPPSVTTTSGIPGISTRKFSQVSCVVLRTAAIRRKRASSEPPS